MHMLAICAENTNWEHMYVDTICNEGSMHVAIMKLRSTLSIRYKGKVWEDDPDLLLTGFACVCWNKHILSISELVNRMTI